MSAGRGSSPSPWSYWALAPGGVGIAALVFGAASALQFFFQATGWQIPYQVFLLLPYALTLGLLAVRRGRAAAPAALGQS